MLIQALTLLYKNNQYSNDKESMIKAHKIAVLADVLIGALLITIGASAGSEACWGVGLMYTIPSLGLGLYFLAEFKESSDSAFINNA